MDRGGAGGAGDVGHRVVGRSVGGGEGGVSVVRVEFGRGPEVRVPVRGGVSRVRHVEGRGVSGGQLAGGVEGGLAVTLREGGGGAVVLPPSVQGVLSIDQVLPNILYF